MAAADDADYFARLDAQLTEIIRLARDPRLHARMSGGDPGDSRLFLLLNLLYDRGTVRASDLRTMLAVDQSTVSRQLAALAERGFIVRETDPDDRRASSVSVSETGRAAIASARTAWQETLGQMMGDWSPVDRDTLLTLLGRLSSNLEPIVRGDAPDRTEGNP